MTDDQRSIEYQKRLEQEQLYKESQKKDLIKGLIKSKVYSSLQEKQQIEQQVKDNAKMEQARIRGVILSQLEQQKQENAHEKNLKSLVANQYHNDLLLQEQLKRQK